METLYVALGFGVFTMLVVLANKLTKLQDTLDEIKYLLEKSVDRPSS